MEPQERQENVAESPPRPPSPPRRPPSPGIGSVQLKDCMKDLLNFTLTSSINGEVDLGLSRDFCSQLLQEDPSNPFPSSADIPEGVPSYPLYKHLASSICQFISSGIVLSFPDKLPQMHGENSSKLKEEEWTKLIMENGTELQNILETVNFELHVQEPYFSQLKDGQKTVEGRCACGNYNRIAAGAFILFNKCLLLQVQDVCRYVSFHEMLIQENLRRVLPGVATFEEGVRVYRNFYSEEKESANGVLAISVTKPTSQPQKYVAAILHGLSYDGIRRMLNMVHTIGTISEKLPPPTSALVSSFLAPHNLQVKCSMLTNGARALAKHVNRSSAKYWGNFCGNDSDKNRLAFDVISHLVVHCCWLNMHMVPQHGVVFEIRVSEGYGARWSEDGKKFIGFLEPYMIDGHARAWKH